MGSLDDLVAKCDERARYNAVYAKKKSRAVLALRLVTELPLSFFKYYIWRTHIFGGLMGFQYAMILSFYRFVRIVRMYNGATQDVGLRDVGLNVDRPAGTHPKTDPSAAPHSKAAS